jgi:6-phosphogluconolactonase (cycloisomerase 2 family)
MRFVPRAFLSVFLCLFVRTIALATTPTIVVTSPANNSQTTSPVNYVATAASPDCPQGISSIEIYSAPHNVAYMVPGGALDGYVNLPTGTYNTVVQAFDNCGGVVQADVTVATTGESQPGGFVYTTNNNNSFNGIDAVNVVYGFTIVPSNGALAATGQGSVNANNLPQFVTSDKGGYRLYVGDYWSGDIFPYFIDRQNGYIFPVPGAPFAVNRSVTSIAVHPSGDWVFATGDENASGDGISVFAVQSNGSLVEAAGSPYSTQPGPFRVVMDPSGQYLYVAMTEDGGSNQNFYVDGFSFDASTGALTPLPGSPFAFLVPSACGSPADLFPYGLLDDAGKYLYIGEPDINYIYGAAIASDTGTLNGIAGSPWADYGGCIAQPNSAIPISIAIDGTGKFMYALNQGTSSIAIYSIGANGALTFLKYEAVGQACNGNLGTDSTGSYLYVGTCLGLPTVYSGYLAVSGFAINHATGDLTPTPGSPYNYYPGTSGDGWTMMQGLTVTP